MHETVQKRDNVFANRNFRLVFLGALVSELGAILYSFAVSFYILDISGNNAFLQGLYLALCGATLLVFTPVGGVLGDRFNKARIMVVCDFLKSGTILLPVLIHMGANLLAVFSVPLQDAAGRLTGADGAAAACVIVAAAGAVSLVILIILIKKRRRTE